MRAADRVVLVLDTLEASTIAHALQEALDAAPDEHRVTIEIDQALRAVREAMAETEQSFDSMAGGDGDRHPAPPRPFHPSAGSGAIDDAGSPRPAGEPSPPPSGPNAAAHGPAAAFPITPERLAALLVSPVTPPTTRALAYALSEERAAHEATALGLGRLLARAIARDDEDRSAAPPQEVDGDV